MEATKDQKRLIAINTPNKAIKEEWVQWATGDVRKTSTNDLSFEQANMILVELRLKPHKLEFWAKFDSNNKQHRQILSIMHQAKWTTKNTAQVDIPDLNKLDAFLKSSKSPVRKPIIEMNQIELSKIIAALSNIVRTTWK